MKKRRMGLFSKAVVAIFAVYAAMMLLTLQAQINEKKALNEHLSRQATEMRVSNSALSEAIASEQDRDMFIRLARRIGYGMPGEIMIYDASP